jgi:hypothetical protein
VHHATAVACTHRQPQVLPGTIPSPPPLFIENPLHRGTKSLSAAERCARGFIGTRITNYGDDAVSLFGAQANALHRHLFRCAELTVTKLNLITKGASFVAALQSGEKQLRNYFCCITELMCCGAFETNQAKLYMENKVC